MDGVRYTEDGFAPIVGVEDSTRKVVCMATDAVNTDLMEILPSLNDEGLRWKFTPDKLTRSPYLKLQTRRWYGWATIDEEYVSSPSSYSTLEQRLRDAGYSILRRQRHKLDSRKFYGTTP